MIGNGMKKRALSLFVGLVAGVASASARADSLVYSTDFEDPTGPEWSLTARAYSTYFTNFSGRFGNQAQTLSLDLPAGEYTVNFDAYIIDSWDGYSTYGPDRFGVKINGASVFYHYFSNVNGAQTYTGTGAHGYFGFSSWRDAVYPLSFTFQHAGGAATVAFLGTGLQSISDESWGIDNLELTRRNVAPSAALSAPATATTDDVLLNVDPDTFNLKSNGRFVTSYLKTDPAGRALVHVSATGSTDANGDALSFAWTVRDASGAIVATMSGIEADTDLPPGQYTVEVAVSDGQATSSATAAISVSLLDATKLPASALYLNGVRGSTAKLELADTLTVKFDRAALGQTLAVGESVEVYLTGQARGSDKIRVIQE